MPRTFSRAGKDAYLDPIRQILIEATPEEAVRQELLERLFGELAVPVTAIEVEYVLSKSRGRSRRRADVVIMGADGSPLMVLECKAPRVLLHDRVLEQVLTYAEELGAPFAGMYNGRDFECLTRTASCWQRVVGFPLVAGRTRANVCFRAARSRDFKPPTWKQLTNLSWLHENDSRLFRDWGYCVLGEDTPDELKPAIYALYTALYHQPKIADTLPKRLGAVSVEEWLGLQHLEYGNYSGGTFPGLYASFRLRDARGDDQIVRIGFFACAHTENDPKFGNRLGTSGIHVAIDDFDNSPHMSLELSLDACLSVNPRRFELAHDGKITVGRLGAAKRDLLLSFVAERAPDLVKHGRLVQLGSTPAGKTLSFSDIADIVFNLLRYALIRDEFRGWYRNQRSGS